MPCAHCGHAQAMHAGGHAHCTRCTCRDYVAIVEMHPVEAQALELGFVIQDPCGEPAVTLARELLRLIRDRDDATVLALLGEVRALQLKFRRTA